jgi:hypothetical protein
MLLYCTKITTYGNLHWGKGQFLKILRGRNVNRKKLPAMLWNVKNYIFGIVMTNPIKN